MGDYLVKSKPKLTHIFASPLQRAFKTADVLRAAQVTTGDGAQEKAEGDKAKAIPEVTSVPELVEQDFGFYEGKPFHARQWGSNKSRREGRHDDYKKDPGFVDVEAKESLNKRCDAFRDEHLLPLLGADTKSDELVVAVVSHGILLSHLWRSLLRRLPPKSIVVDPDVFHVHRRGRKIVLEHLGGWSNTGFLELSFERSAPPPGFTVSSFRLEKRVDTDERQMDVPSVADIEDSNESTLKTLLGTPRDVAPDTPEPTKEARASSGLDASPTPKISLQGYKTAILAINGREHLQNLKRNRGGSDFARYDENQKTIEAFFKRPKTS